MEDSTEDKPLRLMMLSQGYPPFNYTGAPLQAFHLSSELRKSGADVEITTNQPWPRSRMANRKVEQALTVNGYIDLPGLGPVSRFAGALVNRYPRHRWDVVHGHALSPMVLGAALARTAKDAPILVKPSLGGPHGEGEVTRILRSPARALLLKALHKIDMFAVLDDLIDNDLEQVGVPSAKRWRISNGVDINTYRPLQPSEKPLLRAKFGLPTKTLVLFSGQLCQRKGLPELLDAWHRNRSLAEHSVLVVCGDGPLKSMVAAKAKHSKGKIVYLGALPSTAEITRLADILILPSRLESFGNVVMEALASGVPVAATSTGIASLVLEDGKAGWIISEPSIAAINDVLAKISPAKPDWTVMGAAGRAIAEQYSFAQIAKAYLKIYRNLVAQG